MADMLNLHSGFEFKLDGKVHKMKKLTRSRYEKLSLDQAKVQKDEKLSEEDKGIKLLDLAEELFKEQGLSDETIKSLPFDAYSILTEAMIKKSL